MKKQNPYSSLKDIVCFVAAQNGIDIQQTTTTINIVVERIKNLWQQTFLH